MRGKEFWVSRVLFLFSSNFISRVKGEQERAKVQSFEQMQTLFFKIYNRVFENQKMKIFLENNNKIIAKQILNFSLEIKK